MKIPRPILVAILGACVFGVIAIASVLFVPAWIASNLDYPGAAWRHLAPTAQTQELSSVRQSILFSLGGVIALVGTVLSIQRFIIDRRSDQRADDQHRLTVDENRTSRYTAAVAQLGSDREDIQLGGIYALERLANDSPNDKPVIGRVLAAASRNRSIRRQDGTVPTVEPLSEVEIALVAVCVRGGFTDIDLRGASMRGIDLINADLSGVVLTGADLTSANLMGAQFKDAKLDGVDFSGANLLLADLTDADASGAKFDRTVLTRACLQGSNLSSCSFTYSRLDDADLKGANLQGVNLSTTDIKNAVFRDANISLVTFPVPSADAEQPVIDLDGARWYDEPGAPEGVNLYMSDLFSARFEDPWRVVQRRDTSAARPSADPDSAGAAAAAN